MRGSGEGLRVRVNEVIRPGVSYDATQGEEETRLDMDVCPVQGSLGLRWTLSFVYYRGSGGGPIDCS